MALGKRQTSKQQDIWIESTSLPRSPGHPFYRRLNQLLSECGFDEFAEETCRPFYADGVGRPSIPPGVYFRMLLIGYFEGIDSQRGIAWRCSDSLSLRDFLGLGATERSPDHSSLTVIRKRLSLAVHAEVFSFVLGMAEQHGLLRGKTLGVDATNLEANAAMKAIVRRDSGEDWKEYLNRIAAEEDEEIDDDDDLRRFDRSRPKKVSNKDWTSPSDPDSRIARMKDGRTRLSYKLEHALDLDTEVLVAASIYHADQGDTRTLIDSIGDAMENTFRAGIIPEYEEVVADKGYHKAELLDDLSRMQFRTYIPEPSMSHRRSWRKKPPSWQEATYANRRRVKGKRGRALQRLRGERVERSFAKTCCSGKARRTWIRGRLEVFKRYLIHGAAYNLGIILRSICGVGTPRGVGRAFLGQILNAIIRFWVGLRRLVRVSARFSAWIAIHRWSDLNSPYASLIRAEAASSTAC